MEKKPETEKNESAVALGRLGGKALAKKRGKNYMKELGKRGAEVRWSKKNDKE